MAAGLALLLAPPAFAQVAIINLRWTAPGDDGNIGTATLYEIGYHNTKPDTTSAATIWSDPSAAASRPARENL